MEESVVSAIAGSEGLSLSKRLSSSDEKCCASPADPPLPQLRILPSESRELTMSEPAFEMSEGRLSMEASLVLMLSLKC